jgi:chromosome segregation protein
VRIERLSLAPYGIFADRALDFRSEAALHVVLGANESGKTTTLSAVSDLLFGFPTQTTYDFAHDMRLLRVGGALRMADGSLQGLKRRKGAKNTLVDENDRPLPDDHLTRWLGPVDRAMFAAEFGLTADALRKGGRDLLKEQGSLAETLAASSAGLSALSALREKLAAEADALFTPRKSAGKTFYLALERHDDAERRLREAIVTADALAGADDAALRASAREDALTAEHQETGLALARCQRAQRTHAKLARLAGSAEEIETFADLAPVPAIALGEWRSALTDDAKLGAELDRLAAEEAADEAEIATFEIDPALLAQGDAIDALRERLGAVRKAAEDLPRRVEARDAAKANLDELARRLGLDGLEALLAAQPADPGLARAKALIEARRRAAEKHREAIAQRDRAVAERDRLHQATGAEAIDPEPLKRRLAAMPDVAADADRLRRERAACEAEARALAEEAARLDPNPGDIGALAKAPLPDEASLAQHVRAEEKAVETRRAAQIALANARRALTVGEAALAKLAADAKAATRADLIAARERRDIGFERLEAALDGAAAGRRERLEAVRSLSLLADMLADSLLTDTARAARLQAAREDLVARREEAARAEADVAASEAAAAEASVQWRALWVASGLEPGAPAQMARWRERAAGLLTRRAELMKRRGEVEALGAKLEAARAALRALLGEFGVEAAAETPADLLHREAWSRLDAWQTAWTQSREIEVARKRAERDAVEAEAGVRREASASASHASAWPAAMAGIGLVGEASIEEAEAALEVWRSVALPRQTMARETRSIEGIEEDIASFAAGVAAVIAVSAPAMSRATPSESLAELAANLVQARRAADARERLRKAIAKRAGVRRGLMARRELLARTLAEAGRTLSLTDPADLASTLDRHERRAALVDESAGLRRDLAEIADGLDEAALRAEQADLDFSVLPGRIELLRQRQGQLLQEIGAATAALREAQRQRDALALGRDAVGAARDREEASAELLEIAEKWIVRQAAARLAARAIERHRAAAQDPMVARAGELFRIATGQAFAGLGADYDDSDRPVLVALRREGERVRIEGLSEGARDQLFLALRLALLERRAGEPLPFIGDDILASFDDERTARTLALLAEYGRRRQVIVFTHHRHVADLARRAGEGIDVVEM